MTYKEAKKTVAGLKTDEDVQALFDALVNQGKIITPNWFTRSMTESLIGEKLTDERWEGFVEYCHKSGWPDETSEALRTDLWPNFLDYEKER
jgi:hypothetical protein